MNATDASKWTRLDFQRQAATHFVKVKGRLPENGIELVDWLLEFDAIKTALLNKALELYEEHMNICTTRPLITKG